MFEIINSFSLLRCINYKSVREGTLGYLQHFTWRPNHECESINGIVERLTIFTYFVVYFPVNAVHVFIVHFQNSRNVVCRHRYQCCPVYVGPNRFYLMNTTVSHYYGFQFFRSVLFVYSENLPFSDGFILSFL